MFLFQLSGDFRLAFLVSVGHRISVPGRADPKEIVDRPGRWVYGSAFLPTATPHLFPRSPDRSQKWKGQQATSLISAGVSISTIAPPETKIRAVSRVAASGADSSAVCYLLHHRITDTELNGYPPHVSHTDRAIVAQAKLPMVGCLPGVTGFAKLQKTVPARLPGLPHRGMMSTLCPRRESRPRPGSWLRDDDGVNDKERSVLFVFPARIGSLNLPHQAFRCRGNEVRGLRTTDSIVPCRPFHRAWI